MVQKMTEWQNNLTKQIGKNPVKHLFSKASLDEGIMFFTDETVYNAAMRFKREVEMTIPGVRMVCI